MAKTVFILGAGASAEAGAPVMADFLDRAREEWPQEGMAYQPAFKDVFDAISRLQSVHSKATMDFKNIENIFAAFEMARLFGRLGDLKETDVERLVVSIQTLIVRTLERRVLFENHDLISKLFALKAPRPVDWFGRIVALLHSRGDSVAILTFNYDVALDAALASQGIKIDYGLSAAGYLPDTLPLLKLHGSLNFGSCKQCGVVAWSIEDYLKALSLGAFVRPDYLGPSHPGKLRLKIGSEIQHYNHCNDTAGCAPQPVIVPPTWSKGTRYNEIRNVWRHAAGELSEAESVYIIGYSWPNSDEFFHHLYALGTVGPELLLNVVVIDKEASVAKRYYDDLLGQQAQQRFDSFVGNFSVALTQYLLPKLRLDDHAGSFR